MAPVRFVLIGLPRSGTTWLQTLLNSDPRVWCRGEPFDAWQIDANGRKTRDLPDLVARDADPGGFFDAFLAETRPSGEPLAAIGLKILFQHHPALLQSVLPERPDLVLIHVMRENRLAQFASLRQAQITGRWTEKQTPPTPEPLRVDPRWAAEAANEFETRDFLLARYLDTLPHRTLRISYTDLADSRVQAQIFGALGLTDSPAWSSPLHKQGANRVADRFSDPEAMRAYFEPTGRGHWLEPELP